MKMIKNLSKNVVKADSRFHLREDLNFSDDGNYFRGFDYKGLPITTLRADGTTYLDVRVDYLNNDFTFEDWYNTAEYRLADEFNGCDEVDLDKLIENCEKIMAKVDELNKKCRETVYDMTPVKERAEVEAKMLEDIVENAKHNLKWWTLDSYELRNAKEMMESCIRHIASIKATNLEDLPVRYKRTKLQRLEKYGYVETREDDYCIRKLNEYINK